MPSIRLAGRDFGPACNPGPVGLPAFTAGLGFGLVGMVLCVIPVSIHKATPTPPAPSPHTHSAFDTVR